MKGLVTVVAQSGKGLHFETRETERESLKP